MKPNIYWKTALRRPLRTFLLLLFIGIVSFVFVSRMTEYIIVDRETKRIGTYYRSIGILAPLDPTQTDVLAGADLIAESSYVEFEDRRRYSTGVLKGLYNADLDGFTSFAEEIYGTNIWFSSNIWIYGTVTSKEYSQSLGTFGGYSLHVKVDRVEAGYPEYIAKGQTVKLLYLLNGNNDTVIDDLQEGKRYLLRAYYDREYNSTLWMNAKDSLFLKPIDEDSLWFVQVEPGETANFTNPSLVGINDLITLVAENQRSMAVYTTKDMSAIPSMQQDTRLYYLTDGRWLNDDDNFNNRKVCVVHSEFAKLRNLTIGDKITLTLRDLKSSEYLGYIVTEEDRANWKDYPSVEIEFEIVGLYGLMLGEFQSTTYNTMMYIPDSSMPESFDNNDGQLLYPEMYSFVLKSSKYQEAFLKEYEGELQKLGLKVSFLDNNGNTYWSSVLPLKRSAAMNAAVFALVLMLVLAMVTLLNFYQRRKEFAIQRALGIPKYRAVFQFIVPMAVIGFLGICVGGVLSWQFTIQKAAETLTSIQGPEGVENTSSLSVTWLMMLCGGCFAILMIFVAVSAWVMARRPVLELIQGGSRVGGRRKAEAISPETTVMPKKAVLAGTEGERQMETSHANYGNEPISSVHKGRCFLASQRYVLRHLRRSTVKSISAVAIAMCFLLALGWINQKIMHDKNEIERQYASIVVDVEIVKNNTSVTVTGGGGVIFGTTIEAVLSSGFIQNYHLEAQAPREFIAPMAEENQDSEYFWDNTRRINDILLSGFNNSEAFFSGTGKYVTTEYASGYDETLFAEDWTKEQIKAGGKIPVMISASMIERIGISLGDDIYVMDGRGGGSMFLGTVAGQYEGGFAIGEEVVLLPLSALEVMEEGNNNALGYSVAKFIIDSSKNKELSTFRKEMKELVSSPGAGLLDLNFVLWDEELRRVVEPLDKNLQLMAVLYPVTLALSVLIAAGISMLLVIQNAREAAIMRVLGIGRMWVCAILVAEQLLMSLLGVTIGFVTLVFLQGNTEESLTSVYLMCATLYLAGCAVGAVLTAISVTNRKPLDLLQVKE